MPDYDELAAWARDNLVDMRYAEENERYLPLHHDETRGIAWAREKIIAHLVSAKEG